VNRRAYESYTRLNEILNFINSDILRVESKQHLKVIQEELQREKPQSISSELQQTLDL
jgi:hypothetical protein